MSRNHPLGDAQRHLTADRDAVAVPSSRRAARELVTESCDLDSATSAHKQDPCPLPPPPLHDLVLDAVKVHTVVGVAFAVVVVETAAVDAVAADVVDAAVVAVEYEAVAGPCAGRGLQVGGRGSAAGSTDVQSFQVAAVESPSLQPPADWDQFPYCI